MLSGINILKHWIKLDVHTFTHTTGDINRIRKWLDILSLSAIIWNQSTMVVMGSKNWGLDIKQEGEREEDANNYQRAVWRQGKEQRGEIIHLLQDYKQNYMKITDHHTFGAKLQTQQRLYTWKLLSKKCQDKARGRWVKIARCLLEDDWLQHI